MNKQWLTIKQLDSQLKEWKIVSNKYGKARDGWIKTVRMALCMSREQLAQRLGLTRARINQLENAEVHDAVTLRSLRDAADALGCELIYAIVPKGNSTLENIIKARAEQITNETIASVAHSMSLEQQSINNDYLNNQKKSLAKNLVDNLNKKIWTSSVQPDRKKRDSHKKLIEHLQKKK